VCVFFDMFWNVWVVHWDFIKLFIDLFPRVMFVRVLFLCERYVYLRVVFIFARGVILFRST